jgi:hypothetical protein
MAVPVLAALAYYTWFNFMHESPVGTGEAGHLRAWSETGISDIVEQIISIVFIAAMFLGVFTLPLGLAALWRLPALISSTSKRAWLVFATVVAVVLAAAPFAPALRLPLVPGFLNAAGLGPAWDLHGGRIPLVGSGARTVITLVCVLAGLVVLLALCRRVRLFRSPTHAAAGVVLSVLLWQAAGALAPTVRGTTYDRYLLPLLPLMIALALWALRTVRVSIAGAALVTAALAVFSVAGTHDFLTYQAATWQLARETHAAGVPYNTLDAGAAWTGYRLYEFSYKNEVKAALPKNLKGPILLSENDVPGWWLTFYAHALRPGYTLSAEPLLSYTIVRRVEYSSWLEDEPTYIYLLRHPDAAPGGP